MSTSDRITLHNEEQGNRLLAFLIKDGGYPRKERVFIYIGHVGQKELPCIGYSSDEALVKFAEKFNSERPSIKSKH